MSGLPTPQMLVDLDGNGTYETDITSSVRMVDNVTIGGYGRTDEFNQPTPATLTFTLDNLSGTFTTGATQITPGMGVQLKLTKGASTKNRFTGTVQTLALGWPGGGQTFAAVTVTCADPLADLARRPMRSLADEQLLVSGVKVLYPLGEPAGSTVGADVSGQQASLNADIFGAAQSVTFGTAMGLYGDLTGATIAGGYSGGTSAFLDLFQTATWSDTSACMTVVFMQTGIAGTNAQAAAGGVTITINASGQPLLVGGALGPVALTDGLPHVMTGQIGGALNSDLWVDGVKVDSSGVLGGSFDNSVTSLGGTNSGSISTTWAYLSYGPRLTDAQVQDIHHALIDGLTGDTTDARLSRLASYAGLTATTSSPSGQVMGAQSTSGSSLFDAMQTVVQAEGGVLFADGSGALTMQGRGYRALQVAADLTLTSDAIDPGTNVTWDTQQKINQVAVTRTGGGEQVVATAGVLARTEPVYPESLDLDVTTDADALSRAQWDLVKHQTTAPRLASLTLDALTATNTDAEAMLNLAIGDRLALTPMPSQLWAGSGDYTIEGWTEVISDSTWTLTQNLLPWALFQAFILDDATYGLLDSTTPLGY